MLEPTEWRRIQALQDFLFALSAVIFFGEIGQTAGEIERRRFRCYHDAATIAYCRPFTKSNGLPTLSLKSLGIKATPAERALHERVLAYRNKAVAHTDADRMRLLLTSFTVLDGIAMPHIVKDEGFALLEEMDAIEAWLRVLIKALSAHVFTMMQGLPHGTRLLKDYLADAS